MNNHSRTRLLYIRRKINRFFIAALNDTYEFDVRNNARVFLTSETFRKRWGLDDYRQFLCGIEANVGFCQRWTWGDIFLFFSFLFFFFFDWSFFRTDSYFHRDPIIMIPHSPHRKIFSSRSYFSLCFEALLAWNRNRPFSTLFELSFSVPEDMILLHVGFQVAIRMIEVALPMVRKQMCLVGFLVATSLFRR